MDTPISGFGLEWGCFCVFGQITPLGMTAKSRKKAGKARGKVEEGNFTPERQNASEGRKWLLRAPFRRNAYAVKINPQNRQKWESEFYKTVSRAF